MRKTYFKPVENAPPPLECTVERQVRFEEVDALGIIWHGRYPSWFEDAREALGNKYGVGYLSFFEHRVAAPIKEIHIDYAHPLAYPESCTITARLHYTAAARINYEFLIKNAEGVVTTTGYSIQLFLDPEDGLLMLPAPFYQTFLDRWKNGEFTG